MDKIAVLIPCYNESQTIAKVITDFQRELPTAVIYVYDNNKDEIVRLEVNKFEDDIIIDNNVKDKDSNAENNNIDDNIIYDHNKGDNYLIQINHFDEDKKDDYFCDNNVDV